MKPLRDERGKKDIFWRELSITQINVVDALSAMAVYLMGESDECTPLLIARDIPGIEYTKTDLYNTSNIPPENDLYAPLLKPFFKS